jgi:solute carrier family 35 protein
MFFQALFTIVVCLMQYKSIQRPSVDILTICLLNAGNVFCGITSTGIINVAMFSALRRVSIFMTMVAQYYCFQQSVTRPVFCSVLVMIGGSLIAAANDLTFNAVGYAYIMLNNVFTAAVQIQTKKILETDNANNTNKVTVLFWSSMFNIVVCGAIVAHELPIIYDWSQISFQVVFVCSVMLGFPIQYGAAWTIEKNDALTLAVAGSTKSAIMGIVVCIGLFDATYRFSFVNFIGMQISTVASFSYVFYKHTAKLDNVAKPEVEPDKPTAKLYNLARHVVHV